MNLVREPWTDGSEYVLGSWPWSSCKASEPHLGHRSPALRPGTTSEASLTLKGKEHVASLAWTAWLPLAAACLCPMVCTHTHPNRVPGHRPLIPIAHLTPEIGSQGVSPCCHSFAHHRVLSPGWTGSMGMLTGRGGRLLSTEGLLGVRASLARCAVSSLEISGCWWCACDCCGKLGPAISNLRASHACLCGSGEGGLERPPRARAEGLFRMPPGILHAIPPDPI